jgi:hypothetical protein
VLVVHNTTSELECVILTTLLFVGVENTDRIDEIEKEKLGEVKE